MGKAECAASSAILRPGTQSLWFSTRSWRIQIPAGNLHLLWPALQHKPLCRPVPSPSMAFLAIATRPIKTPHVLVSYTTRLSF